MEIYSASQRSGQASPGRCWPLFAEETDDRLFSEVIRPFADVRVPHDPPFVDQVQGRPIFGTVAVPYREVVVDGNGVGEAEPLDGLLDVLKFPLPEELRGVNADDDKPLDRVLVVPCLDPRQRALTVDSPIGPKF